MALKRIFRKLRSAAGAPGAAAAGAYYDSKVRKSKKYSDQIVDDVKSLRSMKRNNVENGSPQDPNSRVRRQMRVDEFKDKQKKRLFRKT